MTDRERIEPGIDAGDIYRCTDAACACELTVAKPPSRHADAAPRCFCGRPMERASSTSGSAVAGEMRVT